MQPTSTLGRTDPPIAEGLTAAQWVSLLQTDRAKWATKSLNYLDGLQLEELSKTLSDPGHGRKKWKERGFIPRTRNLTKAIIEKSTQLFSGQAPELSVWAEGADTPNDLMTQRLMDELHKVDYVEFFNNVDQVTRLLKTSLVLIQWDAQYQTLVLDILHRGNCEVIINPATRKIQSLIQKTAASGKDSYYRIWTPVEIIDLRQDDKEVAIINREPNTLGLVPAVPFYDTAPPRSGFWVEAPHDLVGMNEMVNLHITDSEWAAAFAKRPTPITNMKFNSDGGAQEVIEVQPYQSALPRLGTSSGEEVTTGPDTVIQLNSRGVDNPFFKYESPSVDFNSLDNMVMGWIQAYASDWSVRISAAGQGSATSGFQLVVEELPNLELRKKRAKQFAAGFRRFYAVMALVINQVRPNWFDSTGYLSATFAEPSLPVNQKETEEIWTMRIESGRASVIDYLMKVEELTFDEAVERYRQILAFNRRPEPAEPGVDSASS